MKRAEILFKIKAVILSILFLGGYGHFVYALNHTTLLKQTREYIENGNFKKADTILGGIISDSTTSPGERYEASFQLDLMKRILKDFSKDEAYVINQLKEFYPSVTSEQLKKWELSGALECKIIDGKKHYFNSACRNLFRIDKEAGKIREEIKGRQSEDLDNFLKEFIPQVTEEAYRTDSLYLLPQQVKFRYTITVKANEVPEGEMIRVWMPYPRSNNRQRNIELLSVSSPDYIISPDCYDHKSIYMQAKSVKDSAIVFSYSATYISYNEWHNIDPNTDIKPYDTTSALYKKYTSERNNHIVFTPDIKRLTDSIVGKESNPYLKAVKIFEYINKTYPWASAREYSTLYNIPQYVIDNKHGDCGQVTLLFITMARYAGIPAKWESGWMLHPGEVNLHDWGAAYFEGIGWVPVDQSFGIVDADKERKDISLFFTKGIDCYRMIVNDDFSQEFYPSKIHPRSETVDFQRGEVEWKGENLYFGRWRYNMEVECTPIK